MKHVVLLDDSDLTLAVQRKLFKRAGYQVTTCGTLAALSSLSAEPSIDLLLSDVGLDGATIEDVCQAHQTLSQLEGVPLVLYSGRERPALETLVASLRDQGYAVAGFICKSDSRQDVLAYVAKLLGPD